MMMLSVLLSALLSQAIGGVSSGLWTVQAPVVVLSVNDNADRGRDAQTFHVIFPPGAQGACTIFRQDTIREPDDNFPDGHYAPRHCWLLSETDRDYTDDWSFIRAEQTGWHVRVEVYYDKDQTLVSNVVEVRR